MMNEQHELYENARNRIKQKKRLYYHFIVFIIGSIFLIVLNKFLKVWEQYDWFVWAIILYKLYVEFNDSQTEVPITWFAILNSLFIIMFAPLFTKWWDSK